MNYLWAAMILIGVIYGSFTGKLSDITQAAIDSAGDGISLCITMAGVMAFWVGMMNIATKAGILDKMAEKMNPFLNFIFPELRKEKKAKTYIATNIVANIFGLGWAATPAGLKAMEELAKVEEIKKAKSLENKKESYSNKTGIASKEMCAFVILNISSLQLIPVNIIAYRSQYGAVNPAAIVGPAIVATCVSTLAAIIFIKIMEKLT